MKPEYTYWLLLLLKRIQAALDLLLDFAIGYKSTTGWRKERKRAASNYHSSAQVVKVHWRGAYSKTFEHSPSNFLYAHDYYTSPSRILRVDHVTLMACTPTHVVFAVTDPSANVYDVAKYPFVNLGQYLECTKLVMVPHWAFFRLAEEAGDPAGRDIIGFGMTARSGSTLLVSMFSKLPDTVAISETRGLHTAHSLYNRGQIDKKKYPTLIKAVLRLQFKKLNKIPCKRMAMKLAVFTTPQHQIIRDVFPCMKMIFNARHPRKSMVSYYHSLQSPATASMVRYQFRQAWVDNLAFDYGSNRLQCLLRDLRAHPVDPAKRMSTICPSLYGSAVDCYSKQRHLYARCVLYENLVEDPVAETEAIFEALGIPLEQVPLALKAMESHSQGNIYGDPLRDRRLEWTEEDFAQMDRAFDKIGVPLRIGMSQEEFKGFMMEGKA